ncbi:hypothetical protein L873DRAFT_661616 [Choiromyces venosus 120613-1]|uniref:Uncharacterized protein n=1 Tax=Choiromyces venosus 120613-1 TaxID=1336337 RepID=A0A3N4IX79_9PEZI|nr:hypothetical protein L873DRAFT_661616 [Choiromyces venosus 120613-1]
MDGLGVYYDTLRGLKFVMWTVGPGLVFIAPYNRAKVPTNYVTVRIYKSCSTSMRCLTAQRQIQPNVRFYKHNYFQTLYLPQNKPNMSESYTDIESRIIYVCDKLQESEQLNITQTAQEFQVPESRL